MITGFPFPIGPTFSRPTFRYKVAEGLWTFEQPQKLSGTDVSINVRMTAVRLSTGGLFIYSPIAPTRECVELVKEVGTVTDICLTTHAYEHKVFVAPFARQFPKAKVWSSPGQWSFPLNLPSQLFGIFPEATLEQGQSYPWSPDLDFRIFRGMVAKGNLKDVGSLTEVAFFHKASRTLLLTDAVVHIPADAPEVVPRQQLQTAGQLPWYVFALYGSGEGTKRQVQLAANKAARMPGARQLSDGTARLGWQRMCILVLCLKPSNLLDPSAAFASFSGRLTTSPVVERLVFAKTPEAVADWVEDMCSSWNFRRIIPCHFSGPVKATPSDLRRTFAFAYKAAGRSPTAQPGIKSLFKRVLGGAAESVEADLPPAAFPPEDVAFLCGLSCNLTKLNLTKPDRA